MNQNGPYVSVAAICQSVLHEKDEKISCIRFIDTLNLSVPADAPDPLPPIKFGVTAFVAFKSGEFVGTKNCTLRLKSPSGKTGQIEETAPKSYPMLFKGGEQGHNLIVSLEIPASESGLYWFEVMLDDEIYTRMPLKVNITRMPPPQPSQMHSDSQNSPQGEV
jgi:hypothetical protein